MTWLEQSARWYGVLVVLTWGWAPLVRLLCPNLPDRGATIARPMALLGVVYPLWLLSSVDVLPYSTAGLWATLGAGAIGGWVVAVRRGVVSASWLRSLLVAEVLFFAAFAGYVWLRGYTPDIVNTEKPMDAAFLSASVRADAMPPADPWFAGEPINYYYLGYALHGALTRMTDVPSSVGFNLALATTFGMTVVGAVGLGFNSARRWLSRRRAVVCGVLAAVLLVVVGNLHAAKQFVQDPEGTYRASWWQGIGWNASRVVYDRLSAQQPRQETINEFPSFSFLLGDLHPHLMALPFTVVALSLALNLLLAERGIRTTDWHRPVMVAVTGAAIGSLYAMNSWDYPTYLVVAAVALWVGRRAAPDRRRWLEVAILVGASVVAWLPFFVTFVPLTGGPVDGLAETLRDVPIGGRFVALIGTVTWDHTSVGEFLTVFGVQYVAALWLIGARVLDPTRRRMLSAPSPGVVAAAIAGAAAALLLPAPLVLLCGLPLAAAVVVLRGDAEIGPRAIATALFAGALALVLATEVFYVRDVFDSRFNTLFKVYYQAWTLFAFATALGCVTIWREARPRLVARPALWAMMTLALVAGAVYPMIASYRWTNQFADWRGLDGAAYLAANNPDELAAIEWLRANADADDVILEAAHPRCAYNTPLGRVSSLSGVPTVIGWGNHEGQWRSGQPDLLAEIRPPVPGDPTRFDDVAAMFAEPSGDLIDRYGVSLIYVGRIERQGSNECPSLEPYANVATTSFPGDGWEQAYAAGDVQIFRRQGTSA